jgi:hypothetical protein
LKSQGRGQTISHLVGHIEGFPKDWNYLKCFEKNKWYHAFSIMPRTEGKWKRLHWFCRV